jgi:hypothetical protein
MSAIRLLSLSLSLMYAGCRLLLSLERVGRCRVLSLAIAPMTCMAMRDASGERRGSRKSCCVVAAVLQVIGDVISVQTGMLPP